MHLAERIARRFLALKHVPKETKKNKVKRLSKLIKDQTGLSNRMADSIADAIVRERNLESLTLQKGLPIEDGEIVGPKGSISVEMVRSNA